jgi:pyrimidine-nucleoside phosphorylase
MNVPELIRHKREGGELTPEQLDSLIQGYLSDTVEEYQISAFLMAVFFKGMTPSEAASLTQVMSRSGEQYDLSGLSSLPTDKHSTGGVGDKISLILAPLVASLGVINPMVSGRGLGHTGGTLDKLDAIPGYRWNLTFPEFRRQLETVGCAIIGQTGNFVPADKRLYALRDVTATVESIPLICASILSKKHAAGTKALVMDVKTGSGAFMDSPEKARALAEQLVSIGKQLGMNVSALLTQMNQPLGETVGNSLEVLETLDLLEGKGPFDSRNITIELGAEMLLLSGNVKYHKEAREKLSSALDSGKAMAKFQQWIAAQGGNPRIVEDRSLIPQVSSTEVVVAPRSGVIARMNTRQIGVAANTLGAGRFKTTDTVDPAVGLRVKAKVGEPIKAGEELFVVYHRDKRGLAEAKRLLLEAVEIGDAAVEPLADILDHVR